MMSLFIRLTLVVLLINQVFSPCEGLRGYGRSYGKDKGYSDPGKPKVLGGTSPGLPAENSSRRGLGISAWGIVTVIIAIILAGMGFYYFALCYPILCKKTRKYDMIGLPSVA